MSWCGERDRWVSFQGAWVLPAIRYGWCGQLLLIANAEGNFDVAGLSGLYFRAARFLSPFCIRVNGNKPFLCSSAQVAPNILEFSYIYPPADVGTGGSGSGGIDIKEGLAVRTLTFLVRYILRPTGVDLKLTITNHWSRVAAFRLSFELGADYCSIDEARQGGTREAAAEVAWNGGTFYMRNRDGSPTFRTEVHFGSEVAFSCEGSEVWRDMDIDKGESFIHTIHVRAVDAEEPIDEATSERMVHAIERHNAAQCVFRAPSDHPFVDLLNRASHFVSCAAALDGPEDEWLCPAAGYPFYPFVFGRDALTAGWMTAMLDQGDALEHTLTKLARLQGSRVDAYRDEEPGRIVQQARSDPAARRGGTPFDRYYGDYASPLMYLVALAHRYAWTGRKDTIEKHWTTCKRILNWAEIYGDRDNDGFLEYLTQSTTGPTNQGWKDSENAAVDENGELVSAPIAPCEVQGYYYAALQAAAVFAFVMHEYKAAKRFGRKAFALKKRFNQAFWIEDDGYVAFGLDSEKRPIRARTSNPGHCLATGIVDSKHIPRLIRRMFSPDLFSGWGIRTLSTLNPAYNPLSYHLGSVWPVENASIAFGLRRYGFDEHALMLMRCIYELAGLWSAGHTPECVGGYPRGEFPHPHAFPRANVPQLWNEAAWGLFAQVLLGIRPVAVAHTLLVDPVLPPWLPDLKLERLRVGEVECSLCFYRDSSGKSRVKVLKKSGRLHVVRQPPVNSLTSGPLGRLGALMGG
ncbi:MAG: hypothetical protein GF344_00520 [Chitinivibrionales bacterium]|nr:hypothetical protein [Chitinivibrionales bacterium]MBD3355611.1 hypothetical protein [Chitinivibrionales bacterium]